MRSDGWLETYRGTVFRWEVDANDHFTVAYYLARFGDAATALLHTLGLGPAPTLECYIRYSRELRVGDLMHVDSAVIAVEPDGPRLGRQRPRHRRLWPDADVHARSASRFLDVRVPAGLRGRRARRRPPHRAERPHPRGQLVDAHPPRHDRRAQRRARRHPRAVRRPSRSRRAPSGAAAAAAPRSGPEAPRPNPV